MFKNTVSNSVLAHPLCNNEFNNCALLKHTYLNKFLIFGDWGEMCKSTQKKVSNDISKHINDIDLIISVGDNFYSPELDKSNKDSAKKENAKQLLLNKNYDKYVQMQFQESFLNCYPKLLNIPWYLCLGNHDLESINDWNKMPMYQLCADTFNKYQPYCSPYIKDNLANPQTNAWNMLSYYWTTVHDNIQFIFLDTNILHLIDLNHIELYLYMLKIELSKLYPTQLNTINNTYNRIITKKNNILSITLPNNFTYMKKTKQKFNYYKEKNINVPNEINNQLLWFINLLLNTDNLWNIVIGHHPPHFFPHNNKKGKNIGLAPHICIISLLIELYNSVAINRIHAHISGHTHNQQIMYNNHSFCYEIITGAGGTDLDHTKNPELQDYNNKILNDKSGIKLDYNTVYDKDYGYMVIDVTDNMLIVHIFNGLKEVDIIYISRDKLVIDNIDLAGIMDKQPFYIN